MKLKKVRVKSSTKSPLDANKIKKKAKRNAITSFIIMLINMTDFPVEYVAVATSVPSDLNTLAWQRVSPPIGRTCSYSSQQQCFDEGKYDPLVYIDCGYNGYVFIAWRNAGQLYAGYVQVYADCAHAQGSVMTLS
jgi:hypothetical protein